VAARRIATLATIDGGGQPRLVPICFVLDEPAFQDPGAVLYSPLDEKPKREGDVHALARVRDIAERPGVTLLFERWSEDWSQLGWLRARGAARLVEPHDDAIAHRRAVKALRVKYPQYLVHRIDASPLIRVVIVEATWWTATGDLFASSS
jgi:PPOX class probable F420-dependent enzyme